MVSVTYGYVSGFWYQQESYHESSIQLPSFGLPLWFTMQTFYKKPCVNDAVLGVAGCSLLLGCVRTMCVSACVCDCANVSSGPQMALVDARQWSTRRHKLTVQSSNNNKKEPSTRQNWPNWPDVENFDINIMAHHNGYFYPFWPMTKRLFDLVG